MVSFLKKLIFKIYVILLMAFTVWYGQFMYPLIFGFEGKKGAETSLKELGQADTEEEEIFLRLIAEQTQLAKTNLGYKVIEQPYIKGRFHHVGFTIEQDKVSVCIHCHGNVPHNKSREVRSYLNMHAFYLACETCHAITEAGAQPWTFRWYEKETGKLVENPKNMTEIEAMYKQQRDRKVYPMYGNYGAKIAPIKMEADEQKLLHGEKEMAFVEKYLAQQDQLLPGQKSQMKGVIHRQVNQDPVQCDSCHREAEPYLDFATLGYPETRTRELTNLAVIGLLKKYEQFYIPEL